MISKSLNTLEETINKYNEELTKCSTEEEKNTCYINYISELKLYLLESNKLITEVFRIKISPFKTTEGYDALYNGSAKSFIKKTKFEFINEINALITSNIYTILDKESKINIRKAIYVLKTYYENDLK